MTISYDTVERLPEVARRLLTTFPDERFYAFFGKMGVGKTSLIKELCALLGVTDVVCSPTFAIINEYHTAADEPVYHFDFYRLKTPAEAYDIGCMDYFYSGSYCFTEWTENIESILPDHYLRIDIVEESQRRTLTATVVEG